MEYTNDQLKALKGRGYILNKDGIHFSRRIATRSGKLNPAEANILTKISENYGIGYFYLTQRLNVEIPGLKFEDFEAVDSELKAVGLLAGATGNKVRPISTCKGTICSFSVCDTDAMMAVFNERFNTGLYNLPLPGKLRINISGCPNNCARSKMTCIGLYGKKPNKVAITIGGIDGKSPIIGQEIQGLYTIDEAMAMIEKVVSYYKENGQPGERFAKTVARIGFAAVEAALLN